MDGCGDSENVSMTKFLPISPVEGNPGRITRLGTKHHFELNSGRHCQIKNTFSAFDKSL